MSRASQSNQPERNRNLSSQKLNLKASRAQRVSVVVEGKGSPWGRKQNGPAPERDLFPRTAVGLLRLQPNVHTSQGDLAFSSGKVRPCMANNPAGTKLGAASEGKTLT